MNPPTIEALVSQSLRDVFLYVLPEAALLIGACLLFLIGTLRTAIRVRLSRADNANLSQTTEKEYGNGLIAGWIALLTIVVAGALQFAYAPPLVTMPTASNVTGDNLAWLMTWIALISGGVLVLAAWGSVDDSQAAEFQACILILTLGMSLVAMANNLVTLFLALELISIPTYILLYLPRFDKATQEASIKYFLLSVFSSGVFLFGVSYVYGVTGSTNISVILASLARAKTEAAVLPPVAMVGIALIIIGLCFKVTAVPFHFYAPDVYQGAPTSAVTVLSYAPKFAGFIVLIRLLGYVGFPAGSGAIAFGQSYTLIHLLWLIALITMIVGNAIALAQDNLKRLLAYSGIANAGYMMIGIASAPGLAAASDAGYIMGGAGAVIFYLVAYGAMTVGMFVAIDHLDSPSRPVETIDDLAGLPQTQPVVAVLMSIFLISLIGLPLTAGFIGKLELFLGAIAAERFEPTAGLFRILVLVAVLNAAIAAYYYLRILFAIWLRRAIRPIERSGNTPGMLAMWACAITTIILGIFPGPLLQATKQAVNPPPIQTIVSR